jgi:hypothetical protein
MEMPMNNDRSGEKIGWIAGWLGAFAWVAVLAVIFYWQGEKTAGLVGLLLAALAVYTVLKLAPWKHPDTPCWRLMAPVYLLLVLAAAWAVSAFGGFAATGLQWWNLLWLLPAFIPLLTIGRKTWNDPGSHGRD